MCGEQISHSVAGMWQQGDWMILFEKSSSLLLLYTCSMSLSEILVSENIESENIYVWSERGRKNCFNKRFQSSFFFVIAIKMLPLCK